MPIGQNTIALCTHSAPFGQSSFVSKEGLSSLYKVRTDGLTRMLHRGVTQSKAPNTERSQSLREISRALLWPEIVRRKHIRAFALRHSNIPHFRARRASGQRWQHATVLLAAARLHECRVGVYPGGRRVHRRVEPARIRRSGRWYIEMCIHWFNQLAAETGLFPHIFNLATNAIIEATATCGDSGPETYCKLVEHVFMRCILCTFRIYNLMRETLQTATVRCVRFTKSIRVSTASGSECDQRPGGLVAKPIAGAGPRAREDQHHNQLAAGRCMNF